MTALIAVVSADNLASGIASAAFIAYLSGLTNVSYSATQYALFSSMMLLLPKFIAGFSGDYVNAHGYASFFTATALLGVPILMVPAALSITDEYRSGMIRTNFLAVPNRALVLAGVANGVALVGLDGAPMLQAVTYLELVGNPKLEQAAVDELVVQVHAVRAPAVFAAATARRDLALLEARRLDLTQREWNIVSDVVALTGELP